MTESANQFALSMLKQYSTALSEYYGRVLTRYADAPPQLLEAIRYSLLAGGKRLRPALVLESYRACTMANTGQSAGNIRSALAAAGALELIHTFSLVHDDLPAMDNDDLRRGRPTNHRVFGEAMAILAGDAMVSMAFEVIAQDAEPALVGPLVTELAAAAGPLGMIGGQVMDVESEGKRLGLAELRRLHGRKTGALLTCACRMGAIAAGATPEQLTAITQFGQHIGLAFQIMDDILDETSTPEQLGKATHKDVEKGKNTYPALLGLEASHEEADRQLSTASEALGVFGQAAQGLLSLAEFVVSRRA